MIKLFSKEEKKVEYLELIYDLIFVYIIGRNNSLLHNLEDGFVSPSVFLAYVLSGLAIIQIWNFSTFYINMYGKNGVREHIFLFINMFLLFFIGEGTRIHWEGSQNGYHIAWALILINIGIQYIIEMKAVKNAGMSTRPIKGLITALFGEALIVLIAIPIFNMAGVQLAGVAILFGIFGTWLFTGREKADMVDFGHLSERAMLYVVFTFGEMIIVLASYFKGSLTANNLYFAALSFLIVVGIFLCYEILYNHIIDREKKTTGMAYMLIHIFLIFSLNNITTSLEFMQDEEVLLLPKTVFLVISFLLLFACLFLLLLFAKQEKVICKRAIGLLVIFSAAFTILMLVFMENMYANILISVLYVFSCFFVMLKVGKR